MRIEDQRHVVVIGTDEGSLSELGLRLARRLHRPFLDNCGFARIWGCDEDEGSVGAQHRLEKMLAQSTPSVIAVSTDDGLSLPDPGGRNPAPRPWVVSVERSASAGMKDQDIDADMSVDPTQEIDDDLLDRVAEAIHSVRRP